MRDFSQNGEQAAILAWAAAQPNTGSFLDLGAYDGVTYSNTAALADLGWSGICVDAAPDAVAACAARYSARADIDVIQGAFSKRETASVRIHWARETMYSGLLPNRRGGITLERIRVDRVNVNAFAERIRQLPQPLFCSIDLEGASIDATEWLLEHADPACLCVEANNPTERAALSELLEGWNEIELPGNHVNMLFSRVLVTA